MNICLVRVKFGEEFRFISINRGDLSDSDKFLEKGTDKNLFHIPQFCETPSKIMFLQQLKSFVSIELRIWKSN